MILSVLGFFLWGWFLVSVPCGQRKFPSMISIFLNLLRLALCLSCGLSLKMFYVYLKRTCILLLWDEKLSIYQLITFHLCHCSNATIYFLIFCLEDLSIFDTEVLKSPTILVLLSISFLKSSKIFFMYLGAPMLGTYIFTMFISSWWILPLSIMKWPSGSLFMALFLKSVLSAMCIATPAFFLPFHLLGILYPVLHFQSV